MRRALAAMALALLMGCAAREARDVRVTIVNTDGEPIPDAVFYAEAYDETGAFAFLWDHSGQAGEVPRSAREPLKMPWRPDSRIALVAFAPGYVPAVIRDPTGRITSDGGVLRLESGPGSEPALADLGFPFPDGSDLRARIAGPEAELLRQAFLAAYERLPADRGELGAKIEALRGIR